MRLKKHNAGYRPTRARARAECYFYIGTLIRAVVFGVSVMLPIIPYVTFCAFPFPLSFPFFFFQQNQS